MVNSCEAENANVQRCNCGRAACKSAKVDATKSRGGGGKRLAVGSGRDAEDAMSSHPYPRRWQRPTKGRIQTRAARGAAPTLTEIPG